MATAVGLDIGTNSIKIAEVRKSRHGCVLVRLGRRATPKDAIKSGVIVKQREVAAGISALLKELKLRPKNVVTAVAGQSVVVRTLTLPQMSREEMEEAIRWEVQSQLPFPLDEGVCDFDVIETVIDGGAGQAQQKVGLVAARREIVNSFVDTLRLCRVFPKVVDVQPFAITRSVSMRECGADLLKMVATSGAEGMDDSRAGGEPTRPGLPQQQDRGELPSLDDLEHMDLDELRLLAPRLDPDEGDWSSPFSEPAISHREAAAARDTSTGEDLCLAVLDIGAGTTDVIVHAGRGSMFTRFIPVGGDVITEAIAKTLYCSRDEAEALKKTTDWVQGMDLESGEPADPLVVSAMESVVRDLVREIRRTIDFYNTEHRDRPIRGGVLVGGGAKLTGLVDYLSYQLEIPMVVGNPYARVRIDHRRLDLSLLCDEAPLMAVSVGLAVRGAEEF